MNIKPTEIREITQKEIEIIVSYLKEDTRKDLLNDYTKVFVLNTGVYIISISFSCIKTRDINTNKEALALSQFTSRFFIKNNGECCEVDDDEFLDIIF